MLALIVGDGFGHGAYHEVVASLEARLKADPNDAGRRFELACAHQEHGDWEQALVELERVERIAPGVHETGLIQGMALATGKHWPHALAVMEEFLQTRPDHASGLRQRGRVLRELGRRNEAARDLGEALKREAHPTGEQVAEQAGLLMECGRGAEAMAALTDGLLKTGNEPVLLESMLAIATQLQRWDEALEAVAGLQKVAPRPEPWMLKRAELFEAAGRNDESRAAWQMLRDRLMALPSLERGAGQLAECLRRAKHALGEPLSTPVVAPPAVRVTPHLEASVSPPNTP